MTVWKTLTGSAAAGAIAALVAMQGASAQIPESNEPIKLAMNEWTGQHISTVVAGEVLKRMGYTVEYVTAGYYPQLTALAEGDLDGSLEIWSSNIGEGFDEAMATGNIAIVGESGLVPQEAWYVPGYVVEMCPGLPSWEALNACKDLFATPDTMPGGRFLDYPAEWGDTNAQRIEALGLEYVSIPSGGEGAIIAEIKSAYERKAPLLTMFWEPHWVHAQYDLQRVFLPEYVEGCDSDPAIGPNPDAVYDCGAPASGYLKKAGSPRLAETWPAAYAFLQKVDFSNDQIAAAAAMVDVDGMTPEEAAEQWIEDNKDTWSAWTM